MALDLKGDLARADRGIERVRWQIAAQEKRVAKLQDADQPSRVAEEGLAALRNTLAVLERHREFLRNKVAASDRRHGTWIERASLHDEVGDDAHPQ